MPSKTTSEEWNSPPTSSSLAVERAMQSASEPDRLLFIDDNPRDRELFGIMVSRHNCTLDTASNGAIGLKMAAENTYKIIFLDVQLTDMDGITVFRQLRELKAAKDGPVVVVFSGRVTTQLVEDFERIGFIAFVHKPAAFNQSFMDEMLRAFGVRRKVLVRQGHFRVSRK